MHIIAGIYKKKKIYTPKGVSTRPTSGRLRETLFNIVHQQIQGSAFLDLFAGSGAMGLEAISRGAESVTFIDKQRECIQCIHRNVAALGVESRTKILHGDVLVWIQKLVQKGVAFDFAFIDPPYGMKREEMTISAYLLEAINEAPLLKKGGMLFLEDASSVQLPTMDLSHLTFLSSRKIGGSQLWQFGKL